jgi:hypothetical protein
VNTPSKLRKKTVELQTEAPRSRIRRDPPPVVKDKVYVSPDERDRWVVTVGVVAFALALFVIILAASNYAGWSPSQYNVQVNASE